MNRTALATVTGLILGLALVFGNFGDMLIVASARRDRLRRRQGPRRRRGCAGMALAQPPRQVSAVCSEPTDTEQANRQVPAWAAPSGDDQHRRPGGGEDRRPGRGREPGRRRRGRPDAGPGRARRGSPRRARHRPRRAAQDHRRGRRLESLREPGDQRPLARLRSRGHPAGPRPCQGPGQGTHRAGGRRGPHRRRRPGHRLSPRRRGSGRGGAARCVSWNRPLAFILAAALLAACVILIAEVIGFAVHHSPLLVHWSTWYRWARRYPVGRDGRPGLVRHPDRHRRGDPRPGAQAARASRLAVRSERRRHRRGRHPSRPGRR